MKSILLNYLILPALSAAGIAGAVVALGKHLSAPFALLVAVLIVCTLVNLVKDITK